MVKTRSKAKYDTRIREIKNFSRTIETTVRFTRASGKDIDVHEVHSLLTNIQKSLGEDAKIMVRAMNINRMFTFKGFDQPELNIEQFEEYYAGKVKFTEKFEKFAYVEITSLINKPKVKK